LIPREPRHLTLKKFETPTAFIETLRSTGNVRAACDAVGISRQTAYYWRSNDAEFAAAWAQAIEDATDHLEEVARQRALETSDTLMIFLLKAHRPDKFRDTHRIEFKHLSDDELVNRAKGIVGGIITEGIGEADDLPALSEFTP
jgi:hypothetical protein